MRDEKLLQQILDAIKPEHKEEVEKLLKTLTAEWDKLPEDQKLYYYINGVVEFIFDDQGKEWDKFPEDLGELTIEHDDWKNGILDKVIDYICPETDADFPELDNEDIDWFDIEWDENKKPQPELPQFIDVIVTIDTTKYDVGEVKALIQKCLEDAGIKSQSICDKPLRGC